MLSPLPRRGDWVPRLLASPVVSAFPDMAVGSARASTFSRLIRRSLALRPVHSRCHQVVTRLTEGFNYFVTSTVAPVASGWSICRVGFSPTGKRRLFTAHANSGNSAGRNRSRIGARQDLSLTRDYRCAVVLVTCCGAALVLPVICDAVTNLRRIGTYRAPLFSALASAETRLYRELTISFFRPTRRV